MPGGEREEEEEEMEESVLSRSLTERFRISISKYFPKRWTKMRRICPFSGCFSASQDCTRHLHLLALAVAKCASSMSFSSVLSIAPQMVRHFGNDEKHVGIYGSLITGAVYTGIHELMKSYPWVDEKN